jgi:hypothetical protein
MDGFQTDIAEILERRDISVANEIELAILGADQNRMTVCTTPGCPRFVVERTVVRLDGLA